MYVCMYVYLYFIHSCSFSSPFGAIPIYTLPSFLTVLVCSFFLFYLCPFIVIFLLAPSMDSFFFCHFLFSPFIFLHSFFHRFLRSVVPLCALILNAFPHLIFPTFFFSSLPVSLFKKEFEVDCLKYEAGGCSSQG
jgi:hypothetical protein